MSDLERYLCEPAPPPELTADFTRRVAARAAFVTPARRRQPAWLRAYWIGVLLFAAWQAAPFVSLLHLAIIVPVLFAASLVTRRTWLRLLAPMLR